jgi:phosphohistidine phosphatase SixA
MHPNCKRRIIASAVLAGITAMSLLLPAQAQTPLEEAAWAALKQPNAVVLFRHANAPGGGDPAGLVMGDCSTQRNLDDVGRAQAKRIGEQFRARGVKVGAVRSSQWCRTRETAELAFPAQVQDAPAFNSFFANRAAEPQQTKDAKAQIAAWRGPGTLVVVTHQVNITAITGVFPASGEGVVLQTRGGELAVAGRINP